MRAFLNILYNVYFHLLIMMHHYMLFPSKVHMHSISKDGEMNDKGNLFNKLKGSISQEIELNIY